MVGSLLFPRTMRPAAGSRWGIEHGVTDLARHRQAIHEHMAGRRVPASEETRGQESTQ